MDAKNHREITRDILQGTYGSRALKIIKDGNIDSDKPGAGGECAWQHFHFPGTHVSDPNVVIQQATAFWQSCMANAALLARSENKDHRELALYFIGRGLHCAQDFYAHSNFVALGRGLHWPGLMSANLSFCLPTPGSTAQKLKANRGGYWPNLRDPSGKSKLKGDALKVASVARMRDGRNPIPHPELQLDFPGSWADRAITKVYGRRAWDRARYGASRATQDAYTYFEAQMKSEQGRAMWNRMRHILLAEGYRQLSTAALDHQAGQEALNKFKRFTPWGRRYASISKRSAGVFKLAQRAFMELEFNRFGGALWDVLQFVTS